MTSLGKLADDADQRAVFVEKPLVFRCEIHRNCIMTSQRQNFQAVRKKAGRFDDDDCDVGTDDVVLLYDVTGWYFLLPKPEFPLEGEYLGVWRRELRGSPSDLVPLNFRSM